MTPLCRAVSSPARHILLNAAEGNTEMKRRTPRLGSLVLPVAALSLSLSVFGLASGTSANAKNATARDLPLTCEIAVSKGRYGHTYEGVVHAERTVKGTYELNITKRGGGGSSTINQSGEFYVGAGKTETLGMATFGGLPPSAVNAELTLHWNGTKLFCTNQSDI